MPFQRHSEAILGKIVYEFSLYSINSISGPTILLYSIYSIIVCAYGHCDSSKDKGNDGSVHPCTYTAAPLATFVAAVVQLMTTG